MEALLANRTHRAIATLAKGVIQEMQVSTEPPGPSEVLIKVEYSSLIAFDNYIAEFGFHVAEYPLVLGFAMAGTIAGVGGEVRDLAIGDRVTAFASEWGSKYKTVQQYSVAWRTTVSKIPEFLSFDAAVTIPDNLLTAFYALFESCQLKLPDDWPCKSSPSDANRAIVVYGAGTTVGQIAIELLRLAGYKTVIAIASTTHHERLRSVGAKFAFEYSSPSMPDDVIDAAKGKPKLVIDCVCAKGTLQSITRFVDPNGAVALLLPLKEGNAVTAAKDSIMHWTVDGDNNPFPQSVNLIHVRAAKYEKNSYIKDKMMPMLLPHLLQKRELQPIKTRLVDLGTWTDSVAEGLRLLRNNEVRGEKVVVKVPQVW